MGVVDVVNNSENHTWDSFEGDTKDYGNYETRAEQGEGTRMVQMRVGGWVEVGSHGVHGT